MRVLFSVINGIANLFLRSEEEPKHELILSIPKITVLLGDVFYIEGRKLRVDKITCRSQVEDIVRYRNMLSDEPFYIFLDLSTGEESFMSERAVNKACFEKRMSLFSRLPKLKKEKQGFGPQ